MEREERRETAGSHLGISREAHISTKRILLETQQSVDTTHAIVAKDAPNNSLVALVALGQSIWLDSITRELIHGGELRRLIEQQGLRGLTSNPTIFQKAIAGGDAYDEQIAELLGQGMGAGAIFEALAVRDIQEWKR